MKTNAKHDEEEPVVKGTTAAATKTATKTTTTYPQKEEPLKNQKMNKKKKQKKVKNPLFQDVETTGRWGSISRTEVIVVFLLLFIVIVTVIGTVVYFKRQTSTSNLEMYPTVSPRTPSPSEAPPDIPAELQYDAIMVVLENNTFVDTTPFTNLTHSHLEGLADDQSQPAILRAMSWILYQDPLDLPQNHPWLVPRFALVFLYYHWDGPSWSAPSSNWLTAQQTCDWEGIICDGQREFIRELFFDSFGLNGTIPPEINLFSSINSLVLSSNNLTGIPPFLAIGSLPALTILFLNDNQLEGSFSAIAGDLRASGTLGTFMVQKNNFNGRWNFCPRSGEENVFGHFGLDCDKITCRTGCCIPAEHCY